MWSVKQNKWIFVPKSKEGQTPHPKPLSQPKPQYKQPIQPQVPLPKPADPMSSLTNQRSSLNLWTEVMQLQVDLMTQKYDLNQLRKAVWVMEQRMSKPPIQQEQKTQTEQVPPWEREPINQPLPQSPKSDSDGTPISSIDESDSGEDAEETDPTA